MGARVEKLRTEIVEWARRWRSERCSHADGCFPPHGDHGEDCEIRRNEMDGVALLNALEIAEAEEKT